MGNTSASGGYLQPAASPAPLEGLALLELLQGVVVGITGLAGSLVRPRWQPEPPNVPTAGEAWCAFGIVGRTADSFPYQGFDPNVGSTMERHEVMNLLASFYDLGSTGLADEYAALLRDGLLVPQNLEVLVAAGMGLASTGELTAVPTLFKQRWQYRVDFPFSIRRNIARTYPILSVEASEIILIAQDAAADNYTYDISISNEDD